MTGFLIDTNVLSEYNRPGNPDPAAKRWLETTDRFSRIAYEEDGLIRLSIR